MSDIEQEGAALKTSLLDFFEGIIYENKDELLPLTTTLEEFGKQTNERFMGDRASVERWLKNKLIALNPRLVKETASRRNNSE